VPDARQHRRDGLWVLMPAWFLLQAGFAAFARPEAAAQTTVANLLPRNVELLWQAGYTIAGAALVVGVLWPRPTVEVVGHWLALWALGVNVLALLGVRGIAGAGIATAAYAVTMLALVTRIRTLHGLPMRDGPDRGLPMRERRRAPRP
jgi:hypothetical protein